VAAAWQFGLPIIQTFRVGRKRADLAIGGMLSRAMALLAL